MIFKRQYLREKGWGCLGFLDIRMAMDRVVLLYKRVYRGGGGRVYVGVIYHAYTYRV